MSLPVPGSPSFLPSLLAHVSQQPSLNGWTPDPILFSTILLTLIVRKHGLIVDVETSDEADVSKRRQLFKVAAHVAAITSGIFGLTTQHAHLDSSSTPESVPHHFLYDPSHRSRSSTSGSRRTSRQPSRDSTRPGVRQRTSSQQTTTARSRSRQRFVTAPMEIEGLRQSGQSSRAFNTPAVTPKASSFLGSSYQVSTPDALDRKDDLGQSTSYFGNDEPSSPTLPQVLILTGMEDADSPVWIKVMDVLLKRRVEVDQSSATEGKAGDAINTDDDAEGSSGRPPLSLNLSEDFLLIWVRDEVSAHSTPSYLVDQFMASTTSFALDLNVPPPNIPCSPIIPSSYIFNMHNLLPYTHIHPPLQIHISNLLVAVSAHPRLKATITSRVYLSFSDFVRAHRLIASPFNLPDDWEIALNSLVCRDIQAPVHPHPATYGHKHPSFRGFGLGGGKGGVDTWATKAGQEPHVRDLSPGKNKYSGNELEEEDEAEQWYATTRNVLGVWQLCMRHRVKARGEMDEIMWVIKRSAAEGEKLVTRSRRETGARDLEERILDELIATV